jgi:carbon-monoxide dehydrogenase small subunit
VSPAIGSIVRTWNVNGQTRRVSFAPLARLLDVLREELALFSVKEGCGEGECGACSVLVGGELRLACLSAAAQLEDGVEILTAEGLSERELGRALQRAFAEGGAVQCGYCTPAMMVSSYALLSEHPHPSDDQIRTHLAGHLCRCTGYTRIVESVRAASVAATAVDGGRR